MLILSHSTCRTIFAGTKTTTTTTTSDGEPWVCSCVCENPKATALYDQEDDPWIWWLFAWPYRFVVNAFS